MRADQSARNRIVDLRSEAGRALAKSGMWLIIGYAGASTLTLGLLRLFSGEGNPLSALSFVLAGGALATYAWRSGYRVIDRFDEAASSTTGQARLAADRSTSALTTLIGAPEAKATIWSKMSAN
jgi:hypothetical protein